ncbi:MAG TPA: Hsp70 family protein, partial [Acetomicrobium flavidum]|nr:Hsp70 family protein [Acetomicrobium flavidum]HPU68492.1 Hsp70 family protein [Acetomicrobium flavidum]
CPVFIEGAKSGDVVVVALSVDAGGLLTVEISGDEGELFVSRTLNVLDRSSEGQIFNERSRKLEELERKFARYSYLFDADLECRVTQLFEYVKCLQWSDDELWKDAFSVLELASDRIARAVKYR